MISGTQTVREPLFLESNKRRSTLLFFNETDDGPTQNRVRRRFVAAAAGPGRSSEKQHDEDDESFHFTAIVAKQLYPPLSKFESPLCTSVDCDDVDRTGEFLR